MRTVAPVVQSGSGGQQRLGRLPAWGPVSILDFDSTLDLGRLRGPGEEWIGATCVHFLIKTKHSVPGTVPDSLFSSLLFHRN